MGGSSQSFPVSKRFPNTFPALDHGVPVQAGASSNDGSLFSGTVARVLGEYAVILSELGSTAFLALNLLVGATLFLFSVIFVVFLMLGLVSGWGGLYWLLGDWDIGPNCPSVSNLYNSAYKDSPQWSCFPRAVRELVEWSTLMCQPIVGDQWWPARVSLTKDGQAAWGTKPVQWVGIQYQWHWPVVIDLLDKKKIVEEILTNYWW